MLLRRIDIDEEGEILSALANHYEVSLLAEGDGLRHRVVVDDAYDPDEAVVRLASTLDKIDHGWEDHFAWPEAIEPTVRDSSDGNPGLP